jgi:MoaA/NifB/PqqE/SkfB family radical SAM enzyme
VGWVILKAGYSCNNRCRFCHSEGLRALPTLPGSALRRVLRAAALQGFEGVWLSGGEPGLRGDLLELAALSRDLGLGFGLITNGRMLAYPDLLEGLLARGLDRLHVSLHGPAPVHEALVQVPGAFAQTARALGLLAGKGGVVTTINTVVCRSNLGCLETLARDPVLRGHHWKLSVVEPKGAAQKEASSVVPHPEAAARAIQAAFTVALVEGHSRAALAWDGLPHCTMLPWADRHRSLFDFGIVAMAEADEVAFHPVDYLNATRHPGCASCSINECLGWWRGAWELHPDFHPRPQANPKAGPPTFDERAGP